MVILQENHLSSMGSYSVSGVGFCRSSLYIEILMVFRSFGGGLEGPRVHVAI